MRYLIAIALGSIFLTIVMNYDFEFDAAKPEQSINKMTYFMSTQQKLLFIQEISLMCKDTICSNLDGLTAEQIHKLATNNKK